MASITSSGIGSGIDIKSLVSQLVAAEAQPATNRINRREARLQAEFSAVGMFKASLSDFRSTALSLTLSSTFQSMRATVSDTGLFTASASHSVIAASYSVKVNQLAQAHSLELNPVNPVNKDAQFNAGTLTITIGDGVGREVVIDENNNTLEGIAQAINDTSGIGVTATILNNGDDRQLLLRSTATGAANPIHIAVAGDDEVGKLSLTDTFAYSGTDAGLRQLQAARDASITINGSSTATTSSSNIFLFSSGSLSGVRLDLKAATGQDNADTAQLEIGRDTAPATSAVGDFVDKFNDLLKSIKALTSYDPSTQRGGTLLGDAGVRSIEFQLKRMLGDSIGGGSAFNNLSSIGITAQRDGTLNFDSSQLQSALATDPAGVAKLFLGAEATSGAAAVDGLGHRFKNYLDDVLGANGALNSRLENLNKNIAGLTDERELLNTRLQRLQTRYNRQFNAMDALVGQLGATSNFLTQQLAGMANIYNNNR